MRTIIRNSEALVQVDFERARAEGQAELCHSQKEMREEEARSKLRSANDALIRQPKAKNIIEKSYVQQLDTENEELRSGTLASAKKPSPRRGWKTTERATRSRRTDADKIY